ncbi:MAG: hypothetical protein V2I56_26900 [Desulfobacteraceae bacterium]|nr:hypothetical protein [Desulfobacteraceae bacterium]
MTTMYPPVWALSYIPAAWGNSPAEVFLVGRLLTACFAFIPVLLLLVKRSAVAPLGLLGFGLFVFVSDRIPPLAYSAFRPHADAPSLGLGLLACVFVLSSQRRHFEGWLLPVCATLCAWLAVGAKQTMLPLIVAILAWVLMVGGVRPLIRYAVAAMATGLFVGGLGVVFFPPDALLLNLMTIPSRFPLLGRFPFNTARVTHELLESCWPLLVVAAAGISFRYILRRENWRDWLKTSAWPLMLLVAFFHLPISYLGRLKLGGWPNNLSPTVYFLALGAVLILVEPERLKLLHCGALAERVRASAKAFAIAGGLILGLYWSLDLLTLVNREAIPVNRSQLAFEYLKAGGDAYFPSRPLAHVLAQGKAFNFAPTVYDWEVIAGVALGDEQKKHFFPQSPSMVCWERNVWGGWYVRKQYFPTYGKEVPIDRLPSFTCYAAGGEAKKDIDATVTAPNG